MNRMSYLPVKYLISSHIISTCLLRQWDRC